MIKNTNFSIAAESEKLGFLKIALDENISLRQKCFKYKYNFKRIPMDRTVLMLMQWFDDPYERILNSEFNPEEITYDSWLINPPEEVLGILDAANDFTILMSHENWHFADYNLLEVCDKKCVRASAFFIKQALITPNDFRIISLKGNDYIFVSCGEIHFYSDDVEKLKNLENFINLTTN